MAFKLFSVVAVLALAAIATADEDGCICDDVQIQKERDALFSLISKIKENGGDDELPILPAVLIPLVSCGNCLEYTRKKRTIFPEVPVEHPSAPASRKLRMAHRYRKGCPAGYVRIAFTCVPYDSDY